VPTGGGAVGVVVHPGRLRQEMTRRGWSASILSREAQLSPATVSAALAGRSISESSLALIAGALQRAPVIDVIDSLIMREAAGADLD
jgi:lambda repressor-like predicted transcriptional regulator